MNCKTHKTYRGIRKPTATCRKCKFIFAWRKVLKACGFTVAERVPRVRIVTVADVERELGVAVQARAKTWEADAKELLRVNESLVQVRNIGEGAKAE